MSKKSQKPISMQEHREMGIRIKKAEHAIHDVLQYSRHYYARETDKIIRSLSYFGLLKSRLEDVMFHDHPYLTNSEGFAVYYGELEGGDEDGNNVSRSA